MVDDPAGPKDVVPGRSLVSLGIALLVWIGICRGFALVVEAQIANGVEQSLLFFALYWGQGVFFAGLVIILVGWLVITIHNSSDGRPRG